MQYLPVFLDLDGRVAVIVGGGTVAVRKAELLAKAKARVHIIAPVLCDSLAEDAARGRLAHTGDVFHPGHLDGAAVVIAATDSRDINASVARHARLRGIPVNVVDDPALCSFIMPAILDRSPVIIAVSTGGSSPTLARWIKTRIAETLPASLGPLAGFMAGAREAVRRHFPRMAERRKFWDDFLAGPVPSLVASNRDGEAQAALSAALNGESQEDSAGQVFLVGAGPGDPDLLTVKALRLLQTADVIVHDALVSDEILDLARRDADRVYVGKRRGNHTSTQDEINALLIRLAQEGKTVLRLKGGDPFMFGRGGEELEAVSGAGIACHVVPGITAAMGCAASAGIPLTHRDHAQSCVFVTGHAKGNGKGNGKNGPPDLDWASLARSNQTLAIYMGLNTLSDSARALIAHGLPAETPAAVIEKGTTPSERIIKGTIGDLPERVAAAGASGPALVIVGTVVGLAASRNITVDALKLAG